MILRVFFLTLWCFPGLLQEQSDLFVIDTSTSQITLQAKHLGVLNVDGQVSEYVGWIRVNPFLPAAIETQVSIGVASIDTENESRDRSIRNEEFLDAANYPEISFSSSGTGIFQEGVWHLGGMLTIKKVSKPVELVYTFASEGQKTITIEGYLEISRSYFELHFGSMDDLVGDVVVIRFSVVARKE